MNISLSNSKRSFIVLYSFMLIFNYRLDFFIVNRTIPTFIISIILIHQLIEIILKKTQSKLNILDFIFPLSYLYIITVNKFIHSDGFSTNYFFSFGINSFFIIILINEFKLDKKIRTDCLSAYLYASLISCFLSLNSIFINNVIFEDRLQELKRLTFLGWNSGEYSLAIAFSYAILINLFTKNNIKNIIFYPLSLISFYLINQTIILTGSRISLLVLLFINFIILISIFVKRSMKDFKYKRLKIFVVSTLTLIVSFSNNELFYARNPLIPFLEAKLPFLREFLNNTPLIKFYSNHLYTISTKSFDNPIVLEQAYKNFSALGGRLYRWNAAHTAIRENFLFGLGHENFTQFYLFEKSNLFGLPHNLILEYGVIAGIFAIILSLLIIGIILYKGLNHYFILGFDNNLIIIIPLLSSILFSNISHNKVIWFFMAAIFSLSNVKKHRIVK